MVSLGLAAIKLPAQDHQRIEKAGQGMWPHDRFPDKFLKTGFQSPQARKEISAVDHGNVAGMKRLQAG